MSINTIEPKIKNVATFAFGFMALNSSPHLVSISSCLLRIALVSGIIRVGRGIFPFHQIDDKRYALFVIRESTYVFNITLECEVPTNAKSLDELIFFSPFWSTKTRHEGVKRQMGYREVENAKKT